MKILNSRIDRMTRENGAEYPYQMLSVDWENGLCEWLRQSRFRAMLAMGKSLPIRAIVHHVDGDTLNDSNKNLVVCEDQA